MEDTNIMPMEKGSDPELEAQYRQQFTEKLTRKHGGGIGFAGPHRTGKTTLCESMAQANPTIPFVRTSTSELAKQHGFDVNKPGSFEARLAFQELVLIYHEAVYSQQNTIFWTDRTPIDMAAYLLAEAPTGEIDPIVDERVQRYLKEAIRITEENFMTVIAVQPGIPYVAAPGKPAPNVSYQEKHNALCIGLGRSLYKGLFYVMDRSITDLTERGNMVVKIVTQDLSTYYSMLQWLPKQ